MSLTLAVKHLYPTAVPLDDFVFDQAEDGTFSVAVWNVAKLGPKPTIAELEAALVDASNADNTKQQRWQAELDWLATPAAATNLQEVNQILTRIKRDLRWAVLAAGRRMDV